MFQRAADRGHYRESGGTRQGIYVLSAAGEFLDSINSLDPTAVLATLERGLARWRQLDPATRSVVPTDELTRAQRWERSAPHQGLILRSWTRDLPADPTAPEPRAPRSNRDHVWFSASEARQLLPDKIEPGVRVAWPARLVHRVVAYHLNDNVHGQCLPFAEEEVAGSNLWSEVRRVQGRRVDVLISGVGHARGDETWRMGDNDWRPKGALTPRAVDTRILGRATYDLETHRFVEWELVAIGRWQGHSGVNGRDPAGSGSLGFAMQLAPADAPVIAPAFIDVYGDDWTPR